MLGATVDGIVRIQPDFSRTLAAGDGRIQVLVHGADANRARIIQRYVQGAVAQWTRAPLVRRLARPAAGVGRSLEHAHVVQRSQRQPLVPGARADRAGHDPDRRLLTALVMAREWERGTLEALFVTPVRADRDPARQARSLLRASASSAWPCACSPALPVRVPLRGSLLVLVCRLDALPAGRARLRAADLLGGQEPVPREPDRARHELHAGADAVGLPVRPAQRAGVRARGQRPSLPARYFVELLQTLFLAGNVWPLILRDCAILRLRRRGAARPRARGHPQEARLRMR